MAKKRECRICGGKEFGLVLDMGKQPLVNSLIDKKDLRKKEKTYPLVVERCAKCSLVQVVNPIESQEIYRDVDYLYFSGDMPGLSEYFRDYATELTERFLKQDDFVLEIGSNDGTMLKHFNHKRLGVDPSTNVVVRAVRDGHPTVSDFFTRRLAESISREYGKAKVIYANNCIAHIDDLGGILDGVSSLLTDDGVFVVECNYWGGMVKNNNYWLIYHDHFSYFSAQNWVDIAKQYDMEVFDAYVTPAQGGSLRIFMGKGKQVVMPRLQELLKEETETGLNTQKTCDKYRKDVTEAATKLGETVRQLRQSGKRIAGYGAAAKGFSLLSLAGVSDLEYFVDDSPAKQGKYTPVHHVPVVARKDIPFEPDYFIITAPNYEKQILEKEWGFRKKVGVPGHFITADCRIV